MGKDRAPIRDHHDPLATDADVAAAQAAADAAQADADAAQSDLAIISSSLSSHIADTAEHGATGAVVGTTNSQSLSNKSLASATNNLGTDTGCIGRTFTVTTAGFNNAAGLTAVGGSPDGFYMDFAFDVMPVACKVVKLAVDIRHNTGSDPGEWRLVIINDTAGTNVTQSIIMDNSALGANITVAAPSSELAFAAGDAMRLYVDQGSSSTADDVRFRVRLLMVTTA